MAKKTTIHYDRIDKFDERWYTLTKGDATKNVINVSAVLEEQTPTPYGYYEWLKNNGHNSEYLLSVAQFLGSSVHAVIEKTLMQQPVDFHEYAPEWGKLGTVIWERYMRWCAWFNELYTTSEVHLENSWIETIVGSWEKEFAGTADYIVRVGDKYKIFDWKTGKYINEKAEIQISTYAVLAEQKFGIEIEDANIVHIPAEKPNKKGYRVKTLSREEIQANYEVFVKLKETYDIFHSKDKPKYLSYPTQVTLEQLKTLKITT